MMTGNSLFAAVNLSVWNWEASLFYFSTIISYNIGAVAHTVIDLALGTRSTATAIAPVIFLLFLLADVCDLLIAYHHTWSQLGPVLGELEIEEKSQWAQNVPVFCIALGFGISNSLSLSFHSYTTMAVTGRLSLLSLFLSPSLSLSVTLTNLSLSHSLGHMHKVCNSVAKNSFTLCNRMGGSPVDGQRSFDTEWRMSLLLILSFIFGSSIAGGIWKDYIPRFTKSFGSKGTQADQADQSELQLSEEGSSVLVVDFYFIMVGFVIAGLIMLHDRAYAQFLKKKLDHRERLDQHLRANSVMKANSFGSFASALSFRVRLASLTLEMERSQSGEAIWTSPRRSNGLSPFKGSVDTSKANGEEVGGSEAKQRTLFIDGLD